MVLYFSDNKETEHKKKGVFYEETLPENAVIFGSTTLKKYSGGPADYMKIGTKRYYIDEPLTALHSLKTGRFLVHSSIT